MIEFLLVGFGLIELSILIVIELLYLLDFRKEVPKTITIPNQSTHYLNLGVKRK